MLAHLSFFSWKDWTLAQTKSHKLQKVEAKCKPGDTFEISYCQMLPITACICCHDDHWFLRAAIQSVIKAGPVVVFLSRVPWNGAPGDWKRCEQIALEAGAEVILGEWPSESAHRKSAYETLASRNCRYVLVPDGDEVLSEELLANVIAIAEAGLADRVYVSMDTYWKDASHVIRPRERLTPVILINVQKVQHFHIREFSGGRPLVLGPEYGVLHHLSYAGPDKRIRRKLETWSHRHELRPRWFEDVWLEWDRNPLLRDLHPTHPPAYGWIERIPTPLEFDQIDFSVSKPPIKAPANWPKVSVVIPLYGGPEDIRLCLTSLEKCQDLLSEVIVVDDVSPDDAPDVVQQFEFATLVSNEVNLGFAATSNRGFELSTGEVVVFLNSDTIVPRCGLIRLIESLMANGTIGMAGPFTNESGHFQKILPTYTSVGTLDLFATDFSQTGAPDVDTDMLVGFCLAAKRRALDEVGVFDTRFGRGMFEDNDLSYRMRRAGYRLVISGQAYVHHAGSKSLGRLQDHPSLLLDANHEIFLKKWHEDLELGFASHLSGMRANRVAFNPERHPDRLRDTWERLAVRADISLCMIVKNEERVLDDCLNSVRGFFKQVVVVDTGSSDRTIEIARSHGVELLEMVWPDSFALARNASLRAATGSWIFWMDADDTLPIRTAEIILNAAISAPSDVIGFVIPVQFVEDGQPVGTRVDHVKLFRNLPGVEFEGRIHEQILPALRRIGGNIARLDAYVLHSGYDTSEQGQAKKRERDERLLQLDLEERPGHPFVLFNLGMTAHYTSDHLEAIKWLKMSIENAEPTESHLRKAYALLGTSHRVLGNLAEALSVFDEGLAVTPGDPDILFQKAVALTALGRAEEAIESYEAIPSELGPWFSSVDTGILTYKRFHNIAQLKQVLGLPAETRVWLERAIAAAPYFTPSIHDLFELAASQRDLPTMKSAREALEKVEGQSEVWANWLAREGEIQGIDPANLLYSATQHFPSAIGPRLVLARVLLAEGRESEARTHLELLSRQRSAEASYLLGVLLLRLGELDLALAATQRALEIAPDHEQTQQQVEALLRLLADVKKT